jgi:MFS family permease
VRTLFISALAVSALFWMTHGLTSITMARIVQCIGGAMMMPVGRLAVLSATRKEDLTRSITLMTWPGLIATPVIGPSLDGFIAT